MNLFYDEKPTYDRSTLEQAANCPMSWRLRGNNQTVGTAAESGEAYHQAVSRVITRYVTDETGHSFSPSELAAEIENECMQSRPDVQPDVMKVCKSSKWMVARLIASTAPTNILRYDGGEGETSGQLSVDCGSFVATSELDLLRATESPEMVDIDDWKSGYKPWTAEMVRDSFQFQLHALLVFENYDDSLQYVRVRVQMPRTNSRTPAVYFRRDDLPTIRARVQSAGDLLLRYQDVPIDNVPAWPTSQKCQICDCVFDCLVTTVTADQPGEMVDQMVVLTEQISSLQARLWAIRDETGKDIISKNGNGFGWDKPAGKPRKPTKPVYST